MVRMFALVSDFGTGGPYTGQVMAVLRGRCPKVPAVDLISDLPAFRPRSAAYLLPALARDLPEATFLVCVVDPGVGSDREALVLQTDRNWFVGPDNGLLAIAARRSNNPRWWRIGWRPTSLSRSFHGRDLFAPVAAMIAGDGLVPGEPVDEDFPVGTDWPDDLMEIVYSDGFGNLITGLRAQQVSTVHRFRIKGQEIRFAPTFSAVPEGQAFWYENAFGLVELAVNQGRADKVLKSEVGDGIEIVTSSE